MPRFLLLLFLIALLNACGTINRQKSVIPVDSLPRGLKVYDQQFNELGETPFFYRVPNRRKQRFHFLTDQAKNQYTEFQYRCPLNWWESIIPNAIPAPFFPTGSFLSLIAYGVDIGTDNFWRCDRPIHQNLWDKVQNIERPAKKKKILILPAFHNDGLMTNRLTEEWAKLFLNKELQKKYEVISPETSTSLLTFRGITNSERWTIDNVRMTSVWEVAEILKATHVLIYDLTEKGENLVVTGKVYDLFNSRLMTEFDATEEFIIRDVHKRRKGLVKYVIDNINLLPNAVNFSPIFDRSLYYKQTRGDGEIKVVAQNHPNGLPKFLTAWGIEDVDNPLHFRSWDYNFKLYPSLHSQAWSYNTGGFNIEIISLNFMYNGGIMLHTPMGAIGIAAGIAPVFVTGKDSIGNHYDELDISTKFEVSWYGFIQERWFVKASASTWEINNGVINTPQFNLTKWEEVYFGVGFYYPEGRDKLRELLPF